LHDDGQVALGRHVMRREICAYAVVIWHGALERAADEGRRRDVALLQG
jgi:hypothetical protein